MQLLQPFSPIPVLILYSKFAGIQNVILPTAVSLRPFCMHFLPPTFELFMCSWYINFFSKTYYAALLTRMFSSDWDWDRKSPVIIIPMMLRAHSFVTEAIRYNIGDWQRRSVIHKGPARVTFRIATTIPLASRYFAGPFVTRRLEFVNVVTHMFSLKLNTTCYN